MARVTVEDCIEKVDNRFELVMLAAKRARTISAGGRITVERDDDKNAVVSLREIAEETITTHDLREGFVKSMQKYVEVDELEDTPDFGDDVLARDNNFNDASLPHNQIKPGSAFLAPTPSRFGGQGFGGQGFDGEGFGGEKFTGEKFAGEGFSRPGFGSDDEGEDGPVDETFARAQQKGLGGGMSFDDIMDAKD